MAAVTVRVYDCGCFFLTCAVLPALLRKWRALHVCVCERPPAFNPRRLSKAKPDPLDILTLQLACIYRSLPLPTGN